MLLMNYKAGLEPTMKSRDTGTASDRDSGIHHFAGSKPMYFAISKSPVTPLGPRVSSKSPGARGESLFEKDFHAEYGVADSISPLRS